MSEKYEAVEIAPTEDATRLRIAWADGHESVYAPRYLRQNCRCAQCQDEFTGDQRLDPSSIPEDVYPLAIRYVGRYAIRFDWSDGHTTGIYPFELLRDICPCQVCTGTAGGR